MALQPVKTNRISSRKPLTPRVKPVMVKPAKKEKEKEKEKDEELKEIAIENFEIDTQPVDIDPIVCGRRICGSGFPRVEPVMVKPAKKEKEKEKEKQKQDEEFNEFEIKDYEMDFQPVDIAPFVCGTLPISRVEPVVVKPAKKEKEEEKGKEKQDEELNEIVNF